MSRVWLRFGLTIIALGLQAQALAEPVSACMVAPPPQYLATVTGEEALIVWDETRHIEHFIRRASFSTRASSLGFLVPTPAPPQLAAASNELFHDLVRRIQPRSKTVVFDSVLWWFAHSYVQNIALTNGHFEVVQETKVGGYDAAVLKSDSVLAVNQWLTQHGYKVAPSGTAWLKGYLKRGWCITAFKISSDQSGANLAPVSLSFATPEPFYPYSEPAGGTVTRGRNLRLFFLALESRGRLEDGQKWSTATAVYAHKLDALLGNGINIEDSSYLTAFWGPGQLAPGCGPLLLSLQTTRS